MGDMARTSGNRSIFELWETRPSTRMSARSRGRSSSLRSRIFSSGLGGGSSAFSWSMPKGSRRRLGPMDGPPALFPITGPMHSLSYPDFPAAFLRHLWPGATPRDCIIATSEAGRRATEAFFDTLRAGYGLAPGMGPSLRLLPLGIDQEKAELPPPSPEEKVRLRSELDLPRDRALILVLGRVSHSSKMDLLPLVRAMSGLFAPAKDEGKPLPKDSVSLVLAGWADEGDDFPQSVVDMGARVGLDVRLELRPGEKRKLGLLRACDIFVSIADNPQETFGITLLEAQAAGLPVIASDYDGYRDLIVHEGTGLLVPTTGPAPVAGEGGPCGEDEVDMLAPLLFDNQYHLLLAQRTAVDAGALRAALARLLADADLRARMGRAGHERVREHYLWPGIIARHLELWDELWDLPAPDIETLRSVPHPLHLPYSRVFAGYPTRTLAPEDRLTAARAGRALLAGREHPIVYAGLDGFINADDIRKLVFLARKGESVGALTARFRELCPGLDDAAAAYHILWALKHDLLEPCA